MTVKKTIDSSFGDMEFQYLWKKKDTIVLWEKEFPVEVHVSDLDEEGILPVQREVYQRVWGRIPELVEANKDALKKYIRELAGASLSEHIANYLTPRSVLFHRDGTWGILFDCVFDPEHGVALFFDGEKPQVSGQDKFI